MRTITLTDHPSNIAVFEAASMHDAVYKADAAFRQDGIQGAIWASKPVPLIREQEAGYDQNGIHASLNTDGNLDVTFTFGKPLVIDETRQSNLLALSQIFGYANLEIRRERSNTLGIDSGHTDGEENISHDTSKLFFGLHMRMVCAREKIGTLVRDDKTLEWWQVKAKNSLFLCEKNMINKALWHAFPKFELRRNTFPRVVDVYDFTPV